MPDPLLGLNDFEHAIGSLDDGLEVPHASAPRREAFAVDVPPYVPRDEEPPPPAFGPAAGARRSFSVPVVCAVALGLAIGAASALLLFRERAVVLFDRLPEALRHLI